MKTHTAISVILLTLVSGSAGYLLRAQKTDGSQVLSAKDVLKEEYLVPPDSFSRIENTKNALDALCACQRLGIEEAVAAYNQLMRNGETSKRQSEMLLERAIRDAETAVGEFEGTAQQVYLEQDLLALLARAGRFDRWIEIYLQALHRHPTQGIVSRLAKEAVRIGKLAGQEKEVLEELRYIAAFPGDFAGRASIEAALNSVQPCFTRVESCPENVALRLSGNTELRR